MNDDYVMHLRSHEPIPTDQVLDLLSFRKNPLGVHARGWDNLTVAAPCWLGAFHFLCTWMSSNGRQAGCPEFRVGNKVAPAFLLATMYELCGTAFWNSPLPIEFEIGKQELALQRRIDALVPPAPTIWADREFLRFCLSYLDKGHDWSKDDYFIKFSGAKQQLRIEARAHTIYCPARGSWLGTSTVSARELFRRLPKKFFTSVVTLRQTGNALIVDGRVIQARWVDEADSNQQVKP